jgi:hypothetical protein
LNTPQNYKQVIKRFNESPEEIRQYFPALDRLVAGFDWEVSVGYVFSRIEHAKRMTIYCGLVKLWDAEKDKAWEFATTDYLTRKRFLALFEAVFDAPIPQKIIQKLKDAETVRDRLMHGHAWEQSEVRKALALVLDFATEFNDFVEATGGFRPFGKLQGFKGAGQAVSARVTEVLLLGMSKKAFPKENGKTSSQTE